MKKYRNPNREIIKDYPWDRNSVTFKELADVKPFMGVLVSANGLVFKTDGTLVKPLPVYRTRKDGSKVLATYSIDFTINGERVNRGYQRFVYAAFHPEFDIDSTNTVITSTSENPFDIRLKNLTVISRKEHQERLKKLNRKFPEEQRKLIAETYRRVEGAITKEDFSRQLGTTAETRNKILEEYPYVK